MTKTWGGNENERIPGRVCGAGKACRGKENRLQAGRSSGGGGLIECIYAHDDGTLIVGNDEAKLLGMEGNRRLDSGSIIAGPFFVIGEAGENFRSLTDEEVSRYLQIYAEPHQISQREVQADMGFTFYCF